ncbi:MAG: hypothetical protein ACLT4C_11490 [Butyricicoccus sp.]
MQSLREAQKKGKRAKKTAVTLKDRRPCGESVKRHPIVWAIVGLILLLILIVAVFSSFSSWEAAAPDHYCDKLSAEDQTISNADLLYTEWETGLQMQVNRVETDRPGYDSTAIRSTPSSTIRMC